MSETELVEFWHENQQVLREANILEKAHNKRTFGSEWVLGSYYDERARHAESLLGEGKVSQAREVMDGRDGGNFIEWAKEWLEERKNIVDTKGECLR